MSVTAYTKHFQTRVTPQSEPIPGKPMVANSAGGYTFAVDDWARLNRFLVLGSEGGSYYASERKLTVENAQCVLRCLGVDPARTVATIVAISEAGRAPKNDAAIFALAIAAGHADPAARRLANDALPKVCRIGTHLFQFVEAVEGFRGWGKGFRDAVGNWYATKSLDELAYQVVKYQQRKGRSHRDVLRLAHPVTTEPGRQAIYRWVVAGSQQLGPREVKRGKGDAQQIKSYGPAGDLPVIILAHEEAKTADERRLIQLIREVNLPRECIPTAHLNSPSVWEALLEKMPLTALTRSLAKMTAVGLLKPLSAAAKLVSDKLGDGEYIKKSRLHPLAILLALKTYAQGHGDKGSLTWTPVATVNDALDSAFYLSFGNVEPAGKRTLMGLDVSGSMSATIAGTSLSCAEAAAAMAMIQAKTESQYQLMAFHQGMQPLDISRASRLSDVLARTRNVNFGGTDCSLPMLLATEQGWQVDTFITLTDNESWSGAIHPSQALQRYREKTGIAARAICVGMTATEFSILDPDDAGSLNVVGFDASAPQVMTDFSAERF